MNTRMLCRVWLFIMFMFFGGSGCSLLVALPPPAVLPTEMASIPVDTMEVSGGISSVVSPGQGIEPNTLGGFGELRAGYGLTDRLDVALAASHFLEAQGGSLQLGYEFSRRPRLKTGAVLGLGSNYIHESHQGENCDDQGENCVPVTTYTRYVSMSPYAGVRTAWEINQHLELGAMVRGGYNFVAAVFDGGGTPVNYPSIESLVGVNFTPMPALRLGVGAGAIYPVFSPSGFGLQLNASLAVRFPVRSSSR